MPAPWPLGPVTESERPAASLIHRPQIQPGVRAPRREARASTPAWTRRSPAGLRAGNVTPVNPNDEELAALRERHPWWQIWRVDPRGEWIRAQNIIGHQGAGSQDSAADRDARVPGRSSATRPAAAIGPSRVPPR